MTGKGNAATINNLAEVDKADSAQYTEEEILRGLKEVMNERTSIIISHRISTVKDADHIVVLDDGMIAESGTHDELVFQNGIYADLYNRQLLEDELGRM